MGERARLHLKVRHHEVDAYGHVNHAHYVHYLETARVEVLERLGLGLPEMRQRGYLIVAAELTIQVPRAGLRGGDPRGRHAYPRNPRRALAVDPGDSRERERAARRDGRGHGRLHGRDGPAHPHPRGLRRHALGHRRTRRRRQASRAGLVIQRAGAPPDPAPRARPTCTITRSRTRSALACRWLRTSLAPGLGLRALIRAWYRHYHGHRLPPECRADTLDQGHRRANRLLDEKRLSLVVLGMRLPASTSSRSWPMLTASG